MQRAAAQRKPPVKQKPQRRRSRRRTSACGSRRPRSTADERAAFIKRVQKRSARAVATTGRQWTQRRGAGRPRPLRCGAARKASRSRRASISPRPPPAISRLAARRRRRQRRCAPPNSQTRQARGRETARQRDESSGRTAATGCPEAPAQPSGGGEARPRRLVRGWMFYNSSCTDSAGRHMHADDQRAQVRLARTRTCAALDTSATQGEGFQLGKIRHVVVP